MIRSENEAHRKFAHFILSGINKPDLKLGFGVPEEEVLESEREMPYLALFFLYDDLYEPNRFNAKYHIRVGEGANTRFRQMPPPEPVRYYYQLDIYTDSKADMVQLGTDLNRVIRHKGTSFYDDDHSAVDILREGVVDSTMEAFRLGKTRERVFKRSYTYSVAFLFQPVDTPIDTYGIVLDTDITIKDFKEYALDYPNRE